MGGPVRGLPAAATVLLEVCDARGSEFVVADGGREAGRQDPSLHHPESVILAYTVLPEYNAPVQVDATQGPWLRYFNHRRLHAALRDRAAIPRPREALA
jgi:hypothetical protein